MDSNTIAFISLIVSFSTFIYNWYTHRRHIKITLSKTKLTFNNEQNLNYLLFVPITINNKSTNAININSVKLEFEIQTLDALPVSLDVSGDTVYLSNKQYSYEKPSLSIPYRFEPFEGIDGNICFAYAPQENLDGKEIKAKLIFNTSRGKITKKVDLTFKD